MSKPILGYWDIRGLAEPCRLVLEFCDVTFEDKRYVAGGPPDFDRSSWTKEKFSLGLDFPNLPYYIDDDVKLTESFAIMKHITRKNNSLLPTSDLEADRCDMLEGFLNDFRKQFLMLCYRPGFNENKVTFFDETFPVKMDLLNTYLKGKEWLAGDTLTYIDFAFSELLDHIRLMKPDCYEKYENIFKYLDKFFKQEKIVAYRESARFKKFPINNSMAQWGGKAEAQQ